MAFSFSKIPLLTYLTFVTLFVTHYGLTFCLFMDTLYDTTLGPTAYTLLTDLYYHAARSNA